MLEPCNAKVLRTVLRGLGASNRAWLLGRGGTHFLRPPLCSELMDYRYKNMAGDRFICSGVGNLPPGVKLTKAECAKLR